ncbi:Scopoletin glucosyltransferase [Sesamum angolense]|uniref:Scopoletin glucosyltransferase n=1 Tax=Sesamum angolense TaxID=2727404 RepID=A0AAE2BIZ6_9LAMI|nr:Scopoletin glucosyltransferase [Sesamum angolense]
MITPYLLPMFFEALALFEEPAEELLQELSPYCLISDMFLPWTADSAAKFGSPRLVFHWTGCFALCVLEQVYFHKPYKKVSSDEFTFTRTRESEFSEDNNESLPSRGRKEGSQRGEAMELFSTASMSLNLHMLITTRRSIVSFTHTQLHEMAVRLEASGQDFIWVARKGKNEGEEDWMPQEYEDRIKGRGLIIRDGLPRKSKEYALAMVTWPVSAEQFYNEKLVMKVVKTGVLMGSKKWQTVASEGVPSEAVRQVMAGEEASGMKGRKAVEEGGSSYNSLNAFVDELSIYCSPPKKQDIN